MPNVAQDPDETLQPPTGQSGNQPGNDDLTLQPENDSYSKAHPGSDDLTLQPESGHRSGTSRSGTEREAQELQPPSYDSNTKSNTSDPAQDTGLTLQPHESNPSGTGHGGYEQDTDTTLQPPSDGPTGASGGSYSSSDTKNPIKKIFNKMRDEGHRQSDGPPLQGNDKD